MLTIYHGSDHIVMKPQFCLGKATNDFGRGFYCSCNVDLAREWACKLETDGFANTYSFDEDGMIILDLLDGNYSVLEWVALLLRNRRFRLRFELAREAREHLVREYCPNLDSVDVVIGYRADDSYFDYARAFVEGALSIRQLSQALYLGKLGEQYVLKSERAFERIAFQSAEPVGKDVWYPRFARRDAEARAAYRKSLKGRAPASDDLFILDILRGDVDGGDSRIPRLLRSVR